MMGEFRDQAHRTIRLALASAEASCRYHGTEWGEIDPRTGLPRCESCRQPYRITQARTALTALENLPKDQA